MKKPKPVEGLVIRYDYLWKDEHLRGRTEGRKERPCAIVIAAPDPEGKVDRVIVAPITHTPPRSPDDAIEIPHLVKKHLGLDDDRSWVVITEVNRSNGTIPASRLPAARVGTMGRCLMVS